MELKEAIKRIQYDINMCIHKQWGNGVNILDCPACKDRQTAISHLETLQKVKEVGGVKRRIVQIGDSDNGLYRSKGATCIHGINITRGDRLCIECANDKGFNKALDLKNAELALNLECLSAVVGRWLSSSDGKDDLIQAIRSHILGTGKKESNDQRR